MIMLRNGFGPEQPCSPYAQATARHNSGQRSVSHDWLSSLGSTGWDRG